jgi:hypothetical protein
MATKHRLGVCGFLLFVCAVLVTFTRGSAAGQTTPYYFANTSSQGHADRASNSFSTSLSSTDQQTRVRAILGGYQGTLTINGPFTTKARADQQRSQLYKTLPAFSVPDPLQ